MSGVTVQFLQVQQSGQSVPQEGDRGDDILDEGVVLVVCARRLVIVAA
jgi:hypothetical protein